MAFQRKSRPLSAPPLTDDEAMSKLEHFCAYRDRCPSEVRQKIRELRLSEALGNQLYDVLQEDGFFDEARFAASFVRGKYRGNQWGKTRLRMELKMRDIEPEVIETALSNEINEVEYLALIDKLLIKKRAQYKDDPQARHKSQASVIRMGFEADLVFRSKA